MVTCLHCPTERTELSFQNCGLRRSLSWSRPHSHQFAPLLGKWLICTWTGPSAANTATLPAGFFWESWWSCLRTGQTICTLYTNRLSLASVGVKVELVSFSGLGLFWRWFSSGPLNLTCAGCALLTQGSLPALRAVQNRKFMLNLSSCKLVGTASSPAPRRCPVCLQGPRCPRRTWACSDAVSLGLAVGISLTFAARQHDSRRSGAVSAGSPWVRRELTTAL